MDGLILKAFCLGDLRDNCYLIFKQESKRGFIVDSPGPADAVKDFIRSQSLEIAFIVLTHAHFDHIQGLDDYPFSFYLHRDDLPLLKNPYTNGSVLFGSPVVVEKEPNLYPDDQPLYFDNYPIEIIHTPGHTPGSVALKLGNWLFSGDTLFLNSIGRTDIPLASSELIIKSIKEKLLSLPEDTLVYPGHGASTTIGREKVENYFLK